MADLSLGWTSGTNGCAISSCILKVKGCSTNYNTAAGKLSMSGKMISGRRDVTAGYSEEVCVECTDRDGTAKTKDN